MGYEVKFSWTEDLDFDKFNQKQQFKKFEKNQHNSTLIYFSQLQNWYNGCLPSYDCMT